LFYSDISFVARLSAIDISGCILIHDIYDISHIQLKNVWTFIKNVLHCVSMLILFSKV
jgi:hypothetical protein